MVVAAHPDDDVWGAGAVLSGISHTCEIKAIYLSNGVGSRDNTPDDAVEKRLMAMEKANRIMGYKSWEVGLFEDQRLDQYPLIELAKWVTMFVNDYKPDTILTHTRHDVNQDHRAVYDAVMVAARPAAGSSVKYIYCFEVPGSSGLGGDLFEPTVYLSGNYAKKLEAIRAYDMELHQPPHPRSEQGMWVWAGFRGSQAGLHGAEAFELARMVL